MTDIFKYSKEDFNFKTHWNNSEKSSFDEIVTTKWSAIQHEGYFRYKLNIEHSKILPGKYKYLAQLNIDRAVRKRAPDEVQSMKQQFDPNRFNFTKMDKKEILFEVFDKERKETGNYLAINVSPLEFAHCVFLPAMNSCLPQVVTSHGLLTAMELFLLSKSPALRMGFNGLCAYASLNHLHFHTYYLQQQMLLETIEVEHLAGPCHVLLAFPSRGFVFQLAQGQDLEEFVGNVFKLVTFLQENEKPHNIFITRGTSFREKDPSLERNHVRLYVWVRKPVYGAKDMDISAFHPAMCEMFGHLLYKRVEDYETFMEETVSNIMSDLTMEPFQSVVDQVKEMFQSQCGNGDHQET